MRKIFLCAGIALVLCPLSMAQSYKITTYAGIANWNFLDGPANLATFSNCKGICIDALGNFFVADTSNNAIRKIGTNGFVTTVAGSGVKGLINGTGSNAAFNQPSGICADSLGNLYVTDKWNHVIRKIDTNARVTTFAGSGNSGFSNGLGTNAKFYLPIGITADQYDNIYVADTVIVSKINSNGLVSTVAGNNINGNLDGTGTNASFNGIEGLSADSFGNLYVADSYNDSIRKISSTGLVSKFAGRYLGSSDGTGTNASFNQPYGVCVDSKGNVYVSDYYNNTIRRITSNGAVSTIAGNKKLQGYLDGLGTNTSFSSPCSMAIDAAGAVFVADSGNSAIRKIDTNGNVTTFAGGSYQGFNDGNKTNSTFNGLTAIISDISGNLYLADANNYAIRKIDSNGIVSTYAGNGKTGFSDGMGTNASFGDNYGLTMDGLGNLYVADTSNNSIRRIDTNGKVTTIAGNGNAGFNNGNSISATFSSPRGIAVDGLGNVFVSDYDNNAIRKIDTNGNVTTLAGNGNAGFSNGKGTNSTFSSPWGITVDGSGNLYITDSVNNAVRKVDTNANVTTLAGASFYFPAGIAVDGFGNVYVADRFNRAIKKISPKGVVSTIATNIMEAIGIAVDGSGNVYASDYDIIQKLTPSSPSKKAIPQINFPAIPSQKYGNSPYALNASASILGTIVYTCSDSNVATVSGNMLTIVGVGSATITAKLPESVFYSAASVSRVISVGKTSQNVNFTTPSTQSFTKGYQYQLYATSKVGAVTFSSSNNKVISVSGNMATIQGKGKATITASQQGDVNYLPAKASVTVTVQ